MDLRIAGRRALVTGSSSGIGYAIARGAGARRRRRDSEWPQQEKLDAAVRSLQKAVDGAVCEALVADASTAEEAPSTDWHSRRPSHHRDGLQVGIAG